MNIINCIFAALSKLTNHPLRVLVYFYFISLCGACLSQKDRAGTFLCLTDSYNREIKLDKAPETIISLSPGITEMLFLLHAEDKLNGISDYCNFPEATQHIQKVGGLQNINIEKIVSLQPDVVLIGSIIPKKEVDKLEKSGITVIALKQEEKLEGMLDVLKILGQIVDNVHIADSLVGYYGEKLEFYKHADYQDFNRHKLPRLASRDTPSNFEGEIICDNPSNLRHLRVRPSVYYVVSFGDAGDYTAPANSHINEIIELAGGRNIGDQLSTWNISREYLFAQNPDLIFVRTEDFQHFVQTYPYNLLQAVKENRVYPIESGWMDVISPRNFWAIEEIKKKIPLR
jgi:iron complex transport system substrate-binding protein